MIRPYIRATKPVLDLGCGFYPHFEFAKGGTVVAHDVSFESLRIARNFGDESKEVRLIQSDATAAPFKSSAFGAVIAGGELFNHIPQYGPVLAEIQRILEPGGYLMLQVGAKWCLDTLWAVLDAFLGGRIGYEMTRAEARKFIKLKSGDLPVTWGITPTGKLRIALLSINKLRREIEIQGFRILQIRGANSVSGIVPLPVQQAPSNRMVERIISILIRLDRVISALRIVAHFSGNVFFVCQSTK